MAHRQLKSVIATSLAVLASGASSSCYWRGSCYSLIYGAVPHEDAVTSCADVSSELVSIDSAAEHEVVRSFCGPRTCWLGASPTLSGGASWSWSDGNEWSWDNWSVDGRLRQDWNNSRAVMNAQQCRSDDGQWNVVDKSMPATPLCKRTNDVCAPGTPECSGWSDVCYSSTGSSCYIVNSVKQTYTDAQAWCESQSASLVKIDSYAIDEFVYKLCGLRPCWLGLAKEQGRWAWGDNSSIDYANWNIEVPDGEGTVAVMNHLTATVFKGGHWNVELTTSLANAVCKRGDYCPRESFGARRCPVILDLRSRSSECRDALNTMRHYDFLAPSTQIGIGSGTAHHGLSCALWLLVAMQVL